MTAAQIGNREILEILLEAKADINAADNHDYGLIEYAAASGRDKIVQLLEERNATTRSPLHVAAGINGVDQLKSLLAEGRNVNERDGWGGTALLFAASAGKSEALSLLLKKGAAWKT